jgi:TusA-related sulfurtransferase
VVRSPVSGTISRTNASLAARPELLNRDPYGKGWFAEIKVGKTEDLGFLRRLPDAEPQIARKLKERHVHCFAAFPDYEMSDIGVECAAVLVELNELLSKSSTGTVVHIISDDSSAEVEMERWSDQTGNALLEYRKDGSIHHFIVRKAG